MNITENPFHFLREILKEQIFEWVDIPVVAVVILVEVILSADNMMIIGLLIKKLPRFQRFTAVWVGIMGSVVLRIIAILFASYLIRFYFFQGIGGLYLMYLAAYELFSDKNPLVQTYQDKNLWKTIAYIIALDLVFSIDSILAAFAVVGISPLDGDTSPKLWIVIAGASAGILLLRSFTTKVIQLLEQKPILENYTLIFVIWIGFRLVVESIFSSLQIDFAIDVTAFRELVKWIFWSITLLFFLYAFFEITKKRGVLPKNKHSSKNP
jgi:YkoY family integral membrane protein